MRVILAGNKEAQVFLYLVGPGATGKSVFANVVMALVGKDRVVQTTLKNLNTDIFELYNIIGKPLIMISDSEFYTGDMSIIKQITGNDKLHGRAKYVQGSFEIAVTGNIICVGNQLFSTREQSNAITRRLIPFLADNISTSRKVLIEPNASAVGFYGPLADELPGILN
jgi:putative DNA primase/helicase